MTCSHCGNRLLRLSSTPGICLACESISARSNPRSRTNPAAISDCHSQAPKIVFVAGFLLLGADTRIDARRRNLNTVRTEAGTRTQIDLRKEVDPSEENRLTPSSPVQSATEPGNNFGSGVESRHAMDDCSDIPEKTEMVHFEIGRTTALAPRGGMRTTVHSGSEDSRSSDRPAKSFPLQTMDGARMH